MAAAMLVVLVVVLASVAAVNRAGSGGFGSIFSSQSRQARQVAESGLATIISQWNQERNRRILVSGENPGAWSTANNPLVLNPCQPSSNYPTTSATTFGGTGTQAAAGDSNQVFYLRSIEYISIDPTTGARQSTTYSRTSASASFTGGGGSFNAANVSLSLDGNDATVANKGRGFIKLTVVGQVLRGGSVQSEAEITREFQIVPKCCQRSFGPNFASPTTPAKTYGVDMRSCPASAFGNFGLVVGINGDGKLDQKGNSLELWGGNTSTPLKQVISLNTTEDCSPLSDCQIAWKGNTTVINPLDNVTLPPTPTMPTIAGAGCLQSKDIRLPWDGGVTRPDSITNVYDNCSTSTTTTNTTAYVLSVDAPSQGSCKTGQIKGQDLPTGAVVTTTTSAPYTTSTSPKNNDCYIDPPQTISITTSSPTPYCISSGGEYHCLIRFIDGAGNNNVVVDSTVQPVNLYLYDATSPPAPGDPTSGTISFSGSGGLRHVKCTTFSYSCSIDATLVDASRFGMFGNIDPQSIDLKGTSSVLAGFFYFPFGNVEVSGGGGDINIEGILWTNNLTLKGGTEFLVPQTGSTCTGTTVCNIVSDVFFGGGGGSSDVVPTYDWVARSVSTTSLF